ncbi:MULTISPECIES: anti-phage dCTP deaminase [unclassified Thioalkalivibrio]|uniref:anti-phage dCTP deaminase n=1 Tax=unclassified Thioalkalivibrio TaxID=2621013 RepID=UPI0003AAFF21|nr:MULTISPECIES: anti-phage dCTP deaminase [unclassified Thioalkalivibrio]
MNYYAKDCELVLALVAPVGVNLDDVETRLESLLSQFGYSTAIFHLSQIAANLEGHQSSEHQSEAERLDAGMNLGNSLREKYDRGDVLALLAIQAINDRRGYEQDAPEPLSRAAHVIRSLKHEDEVETLRQVYGPGFFLIGVSSSLESRKQYLKELKGVPEEEIHRLIERDDKENRPLGQQTRDVFQLADAFLTTDAPTVLESQLGRIMDLIFSKPVVPPTAEEYPMFMAYAASLRSADLARQVGAVIVNEKNDIISTGANDVPAYGGGLYWTNQNDQRDYVRGCDSNEQEKIEIAKDAATRILGEEAQSADLEEAVKRLKGSKLMDITEYGRSVHAEMEALLQAARNGTPVRGGTLFTTTYPCHNCTKHIVAAGIQKVIYIEPYPKSYATTLHGDAVEDKGSQSSDKVEFKQFVGVGPRRFVDLFSMKLSSGRELPRKSEGRIIEWHRRQGETRVPMSPLSYLDSEVSIRHELEELLEGGRDEKKG